MKKVLLLLAIFLLPMMVFAKDIPTEGVTYFLEYPNDVERVLDNYEEDMENRYELIYEGTSNERGEVILENLPEDSELRITQIIPNGYSSQESSVDLKLSEGNEVSFVDYKGIINPNTATRSFTWIFILLLVVTVGRMIQKKHTKGLLLVLIAISLLVTAKVKAENQDLVVTVKDDKGNKLSGVTVKVYAKPLDIDASPAIKFDANGGEFFDGSTVMYYKIGENETVQSFFDGLAFEELDWLFFNRENATREGFYPVMDEREWVVGHNSYYIDMGNPNTSLYNGYTFEVSWEEDSSAHAISLDGNGGYYIWSPEPGISKKFNIINVYEEDINQFIIGFESDLEEVLIGLDNNKDCSHYKYGLLSNGDYDYSQGNAYMCWDEKPDGIYIYDTDDSKGTLFRGSIDTCFRESNFQNGDNKLFRFKYAVESLEASRGHTYFKIYNSYDAEQMQIQYFYTDRREIYYDINKVEFVYQGDVIITLNSDDLSLMNSSEKIYGIRDTNKISNIISYFNGLPICR